MAELSLLLTLPLAGALALPLLRSGPGQRWARTAVLALMLGTLGLALAAFFAFDGQPVGFELARFPSLGLVLAFGLDGTNAGLVLLTALLFPVALAASGAHGQQRLYLASLLALEGLLMGTFLAQDLLVFFVLWEAVLLPAVLLVYVYGGPERRRAAWALFLYTMAGSVLFLAAVIVLGVAAQQALGRWAFDYATLAQLKLPAGTQAFVFGAIALACAVKSPLVPFHGWLPLAYREAPAPVTALMAGVMSKMGAYGFIRLAIPLAPEAAAQWAPALMALAAFGIVYGAVAALRQDDAKTLVAYASASHMGYIVLGAFSGQAAGVQGALLQMLSHGVGVAGLFLLLGFMAERSGPEPVQGLARRAPRLAAITMLFVLASLALPLTSGFSAEFLVLLGAFTRGVRGTIGFSLPLLAALAASLGVVLGATYMLRMARALLFGRTDGPALPDLRGREAAALLPLAAMVLALGLAPAPWMAKSEAAATATARATLPPPLGARTEAPR